MVYNGIRLSINQVMMKCFNPLFQDVLPSLLPYCQTAVTMDTESCDLTLLSVTQMLLEKAPVLTDGSALDNVQTYMLDFGTR